MPQHDHRFGARQRLRQFGLRAHAAIIDPVEGSEQVPQIIVQRTPQQNSGRHGGSVRLVDFGARSRNQYRNIITQEEMP